MRGLKFYIPILFLACIFATGKSYASDETECIIDTSTSSINRHYEAKLGEEELDEISFDVNYSCTEEKEFTLKISAPQINNGENAYELSSGLQYRIFIDQGYIDGKHVNLVEEVDSSGKYISLVQLDREYSFVTDTAETASGQVVHMVMKIQIEGEYTDYDGSQDNFNISFSFE
jgi:hypothetical protein